MVSIKQKPVFAVDPSSAGICIGESVVLTASGGDTYQWSPANTVQYPNSASTSVFPTDTTTYQVLIRDNICDTSGTLSATVTLISLPNISVSKSNDVDCVLGEAKLTASGGVKYVWAPASSLSNPNIANPFATPDTTTMYHVIISNANGCSGKDSVEVKVIKGEAANGYLMASAFTPDGDGNNDCFGVRKWGFVTNLDFSVYNRWGNMVFHSTNGDNCWDGTYKGMKQPAGVYVYQVRAKTICGNVYRKGTVVLIR
jgi:gliding motility-associated-like protein